MLDKILLAPYYLCLKIRHAMYDHGVLKRVHRSEVPTICIGNISAGGTGKTPHAEMILRELLDSYDWGGSSIAVLSRGYKRSSRGFQQVLTDGKAAFYGDEPLQIKKKLPEVTVAVDRNRVEGCDFLAHPEKLSTSKAGAKCRDKEFRPADLIVLDDAFQYRSLKADYDIVLVDFNHPLNKDSLLPFGTLRDLPSRIRKADIIIVTKCPSFLEDSEKEKWLHSIGIHDYDPHTCLGGFVGSDRKLPVLFTFINYNQLTPVFAGVGDPRYVYSQKLLLFTGIAKDSPLRRYLSDKYKIVKSFSFPDHHKYSRADVLSINKAAVETPTAVVVTTEKDAQRILDREDVPDFLKIRLFQAPIQVFFLSENERLVFVTTLLTSLRKSVEERCER